ncbi:MAG: tetratricopeptide repeat protein [Desulfopila sp.]
MTRPAPPSFSASTALTALSALLLFLLLQTGCAVKHPVVPPSPLPKKTTNRTIVPSRPVIEPSIQPVLTAPVEEPTQQTPPQTVSSRYVPTVGAAGALYASAKDSMGQGNYQQAEMVMERALKIEPRNADYWYTMAQLKYDQQQYSQAIQLSSKSKSLAGRNLQLQQLNEALSAKAQQQLTR